MVQLSIADPALASALPRVARLCRDAGGRAWVVGGAVRDTLLGRTVTDLDVEVHGVAAQDLETLLSAHFDLDAVGRAFGVLKLHGLFLDVSLPRTESKAGLGHKGFLVRSDPHLGLEAAARRRDFTINAIALDPLTGELADPLGGQADLAARRLRHCSDAFGEDPLRVLRGMQFVARFALAADPATITLCRTIEPEGLAWERIWQEWRKLLLLGVEPSRGLAWLQETGWVRYFPALAGLVGVEGGARDAYAQTGRRLDAFARGRVGQDHEDLVVGLAVLGLELGETRAVVFLEELTGQPTLVEEVAPLVRWRRAPTDLYAAGAGDGAVRRLARDVGRIDRLLRVARAEGAAGGAADAAGAVEAQAVVWLEGRARALSVTDSRPEPIVLGRHLASRGLEPGPEYGRLLDACYEAQLDGAFGDLDGGLAYLDGVLRGG